jgi:hypothetical protein
VDLDDDNLLRSIGVFTKIDSVGLWCYEATNGNRYDLTDFEFLGSKIEAARGLGTTTLVLAIFIWVFYLVASCRRFGPVAFKLIGGLCILTCLFQGLVFIIFKSDEICAGDNRGCSLGVGGKCGVSAVIFWFLAGIFSFGVGKEQDDDDSPAEEAPEAPAEEAQIEKVQDEKV